MILLNKFHSTAVMRVVWELAEDTDPSERRQVNAAQIWDRILSETEARKHKRRQRKQK